MLLFKFGYGVHSHECGNGYTHTLCAQSTNAQPYISTDYFRSLRDAARTEYNIFFFLFPAISLEHSVCGYVYVWVYIARFTVRQQFCDFLGFFFTHVCQRSIISQTVSARNEFHTWDCQRHIFYSLFRLRMETHVARELLIL